MAEFKEMKLTKDQHDRLFPRQKTDWKVRYRYFYSEEEGLLVETWPSGSLKFLFLMGLFPIIACHGLRRTGDGLFDLWKDRPDMYELIPARDDLVDDFLDIARSKKGKHS